MREWVPFVLLACACGAAVRAPAPAPAPPSVANAQAPAASVAAPSAEVVAAFEALSARGPAIAPGMHEVTRKESAGDPVELLRARGGDACLRAAFSSTAPIAAKLVDAGGRVLAATESPATEGVLGERGPVCVRKGDVVTGVTEGAGARIAWMAWEAP